MIDLILSSAWDALLSAAVLLGPLFLGSRAAGRYYRRRGGGPR